jgi:hypothetical protein
MGSGSTFYKHPVFQAGALVVVVLGVVAAALTLIDRGSGSPEQAVASSRDVTATPRPTAAGGETGAARTKQTVAVRSLPGDRMPLFGTLSENATVKVDGRTADSKWFRVIFPPGSDIHGWVAAGQIDLGGPAAALPVVAAVPAVIPPTLSALLATQAAANARTLTPSLASTPSPTATPTGPLPDLVVDNATVADGKLSVVIRNKGKAPMRGALTVTVVDAATKNQVAAAKVTSANIAPGQTLDVATSYAPTGQDRLVITVSTGIAESNNSNNTTTIALSF